MADISRRRRHIFRTICEIHREMYRELKGLGFSDDSKAMKLLLEAYPLGKKMNNKLRQYKRNYDVDWYEKNKLDGPEIDD